MDIFAHGLWTGAAYKIANKKSRAYRQAGKKQLNIKWAVFWGVAPDLFAFTIPFLWLFWQLASGGMNLSDWPRPQAGEPPTTDRYPIFRLAESLYQISHSVVIFTFIFALVWVVWRRPRLELGGWLLHILIDIPTHTYKFYPTPVFWPVFGWRFDGISWGTPWFMVMNYALIILAYFLLRKKRR
jgi:hypothetical protein